LIPKKPGTVQDEFFGVYCLVSRSEHKAYKNRCYIGYTVDPNRRIRQHNAGREFGGARKTDNRGPWDMVCIIHGFPNSISALRFEWAWQNPEKSNRLKELVLAKSRKESPLAFKIRVACHMLNSDPWCRLALNFRWLLPEFELPFPIDIQPPPHVRKNYGLAQLTKTVIPLELNRYTVIKDCFLCKGKILKLEHLVRCPMFNICAEHFHSKCLSEHCLQEQGEFDNQLFPLGSRCPKCGVDFLWGDLIRDQRVLLLVEKNKYEGDGLKLADGMIPKELIKK